MSLAPLSGPCRRVLQLLVKLLRAVPMRRLWSRVTTRVLLGDAFTPAIRGEAGIHTHGRRRLVVGLGNPGMEGTRHSVGMAVLGALAAHLGVAERWHGDRHVCGEVALAKTPDTHVVLLRPQLLMNVNGVAVAKAARKFGVPPEDILLVHDELDKPLGKIAVKQGGSARGHNGVRSCVDCLQTDVMPRLRVGIGRPSGRTSVQRHVLGSFSEEEKKLLSSVLQQSVELLLSQLSQQDSPSSPPAGGSRAARRARGERGQEEAAAAAASQNGRPEVS